MGVSRKDEIEHKTENRSADPSLAGDESVAAVDYL